MPPEAAAVLTLGVQAFVVGLSGAMSPGSFLTVTVARTMQRGPWSASLLLVGHALLEALLLVGFAFGLEKLLRLPAIMVVLSVAGGSVLLYLGSKLVWGASRGTIAADLEASEVRGMGGGNLQAITQGIVISLSNPWWTLWWATIGVKLAADGLALGPAGVLAFFIGHELADVSWYGFVIGVVHRGKGLLTPRVYCVIMGVLGAALLYMGARFLGQAFGIQLPWVG